MILLNKVNLFDKEKYVCYTLCVNTNKGVYKNK